MSQSIYSIQSPGFSFRKCWPKESSVKLGKNPTTFLSCSLKVISLSPFHCKFFGLYNQKDRRKRLLQEGNKSQLWFNSSHNYTANFSRGYDFFLSLTKNSRMNVCWFWQSILLLFVGVWGISRLFVSYTILFNTCANLPGKDNNLYDLLENENIWIYMSVFSKQSTIKLKEIKWTFDGFIGYLFLHIWFWQKIKQIHPEMTPWSDFKTRTGLAQWPKILLLALVPITTTLSFSKYGYISWYIQWKMNWFTQIFV